MLQYVIPALLAGHGLAHISGFVASFTSRDMDYRLEKTWMLPGRVYLNRNTGRIFGLLWLIAAFILILSAALLVTHVAVWPALALTGAIVSLVVIVPFWQTVPPGARIGAVFDLIIILALTGWHHRILDMV